MSDASVLNAVLWLPMLGGAHAASRPPASTALYYGAEPPFDELAAFDWVVLEPGHGHDLAQAGARMPRTQLLAYLSVGEVLPQAPHYAALPPAWRIGHNASWRSEVLDQRPAVEQHVQAQRQVEKSRDVKSQYALPEFVVHRHTRRS